MLFLTSYTNNFKRDLTIKYEKKKKPFMTNASLFFHMNLSTTYANLMLVDDIP